MHDLLPAAALLLLLATTAAGCASASPGRPRGSPDPRSMVPPGVKAEWLHFADPAVRPGDEGPDFTLPTPDGASSLSLSTFRGRPLVLVFGSYT